MARLTLISLALWGLLSLTAQARARDDVMSGAYRCNVISDDRQWLDCFYGAAQPMRAVLGLSPALAAQVRLAQSPPSGSDAHDVRQHGEALALAARCYTVTDDRNWLDCYYASAEPVRTLLGLATTPRNRAMRHEPEDINRPPPVNTSHNASFFSGLLGSNTPRVISQMAAYSFDKQGIFTVSLVNGQLWQQTSGDTAHARWKNPAESYTVTITDGAFGSFNFEVKGEPHIFKVERQK